MTEAERRFFEACNNPAPATAELKALVRDYGHFAKDDPLGEWNRCRDFDADCADVPCKMKCWLHDLERGWCPWLSKS